jgi:hypothetical protein
VATGAGLGFSQEMTNKNGNREKYFITKNAGKS